MKITVRVTRVSSYDLDVSREDFEALENGDLEPLEDHEPDEVETVDHNVSERGKA